MLDFVIDNIFVKFGILVFQQTIGIPNYINYAPVYSVICFHTLKTAYFPEGLLKNKDRKLAKTFNSSFQ